MPEPISPSATTDEHPVPHPPATAISARARSIAAGYPTFSAEQAQRGIDAGWLR